MSLVADPAAKAVSVKSEQAAADLYGRLQAGLLSGDGDDAWRADAEDALQVLRSEWGADIGDHKAAQPKRPSRPGQGASSRSRSRSGTPSKGKKPAAGRPSPGRPPAPSSKPSSRSSPGKAGRAARSAFRDTGIPGAVDSASSLVLSTLGVMVALSVLFLLLRKPKGFEQLATGTATAVRALVAPVDPLAAGAWSKRAADRGTAATADDVNTPGLISQVASNTDDAASQIRQWNQRHPLRRPGLANDPDNQGAK